MLTQEQTRKIDEFNRTFAAVSCSSAPLRLYVDTSTTHMYTIIYEKWDNVNEFIVKRFVTSEQRPDKSIRVANQFVTCTYTQQIRKRTKLIPARFATYDEAFTFLQTRLTSQSDVSLDVNYRAYL